MSSQKPLPTQDTVDRRQTPITANSRSVGSSPTNTYEQVEQAQTNQTNAPVVATPHSLPSSPDNERSGGTPSWWTLKNKAALLAVTLGTLPVLLVGGIATSIAGNRLSEDVVTQQQQLANAISLQMQDFVALQQTAASPALEAQGETQRNNTRSPEEILNATGQGSFSELINQRVASLQRGTQTGQETVQFSLVSNGETADGESIEALFPIDEAISEIEVTESFQDESAQDNTTYLITYAPIAQMRGQQNDWGVLVYQPLSDAFAARQSLILTLLSGTVITVLAVSTLAAYFSNIATQPIIEASKAVTKLGQGRFDTRLKVKGNDELSALATNINVMATQLEDQLSYIEESAQRDGLFQAQSAIAQQQQQQRESMQQELMQLIQSVEGAAEGDLTVRADLSRGEIGIVADVFNAIVESLRKIVVQVKQATEQVNTSVGTNQSAVRQLSEDALVQVEEISRTLSSVQQMSASIKQVSDGAQQAALVARSASTTAQKGSQAMDQSVNSILELRSTVAATTKKVKQLGEASQQISQVVSLINEIALKTNLLAINASIEAAHAGEEGQGFAVVAGEVGQLAEQSARATKDIERIVKDIQAGTREVVQAMEVSTTQVVAGSSQLGETKESLVQILSVSEEIDRLVRSILAATQSQTETSQTVTELMEQVSASSQRTSEFSRRVEGTLQNTVDVAHRLEDAVDKFKVND